MTFYDENKTPVSSECDAMLVSVDDEDDYETAMEAMLGTSDDYEVRYNGPGLYIPEDVMISGDIYLTLTKVEDALNECKKAIEYAEKNLNLEKNRLRFLSTVVS